MNTRSTTKLRWDPCLDTGIPEIDWEHRRLLNVANRLLSAVARGRGEDAVRPVTRDLSRHADEHFAHEENYMREMGFPDVEAHAREHRRMTKNLAQYVKALDSETPPGVKELWGLLSVWLLEHILKRDRVYADYSRKLSGKHCDS